MAKLLKTILNNKWKSVNNKRLKLSSFIKYVSSVCNSVMNVSTAWRLVRYAGTDQMVACIDGRICALPPESAPLKFLQQIGKWQRALSAIPFEVPTNTMNCHQIIERAHQFFVASICEKYKTKFHRNKKENLARDFVGKKTPQCCERILCLFLSLWFFHDVLKPSVPCLKRFCSN